MKAIVITGTGGAEVLEIEDVPTPEPSGAEVRVRVRACALNRADLMQARGHYPAPPGAPSDIPGLEYAGEIDALGPDVTAPLNIGDRVFGIVGGGGQAEYVVSHERMVVPVPSTLDDVQAAAVPEVFLTAHDAIATQARTQPGERVLIHAVGSGVGTAAVQLAHAMGCTVFGTSRTPEKLDHARALGLDFGLVAPLEEADRRVLEPTGGAGVHVLIDLVGASGLSANLAALAPRGRYVVVGLLGGTRTAIDLGTILRKRLTIVGTTLRARPLEEKIAATQAFASTVVPWLERGLVRPVIDQVFPFNDFRDAHERLASNLGFGKVVLRL